jgi:hypothetical protein
MDESVGHDVPECQSGEIMQPDYFDVAGVIALGFGCLAMT